MDNFKQKFPGIVRQAYKNYFNREITNEEINEVLNNAIPFTENELKKTRGFSEKLYKRYMDGADVLLFSPANIHLELRRIIDTFGEDQLTHSAEFKMAREMEVAARFCIAHYKKFGEKFMVKAQDSPDIVLVLTGEGSLVDKSLKGYQLEVMTIPEIVKNELGGDLPTALANFIKDKKFKKRYGLCALIISYDFNQTNLDLKKTSEILAAVKPNPYESIWFTGIINSNLTEIAVMEAYPKFVRVDFDLTREKNILY